MRKILLILMLSPLLLTAQNRFGYYSHSKAVAGVPGYRQSIAEYEILKQRCEAEIERNEQELTRKYVAFLDGQQDFPELILRKRQKELQQMVDNSVLFREQLSGWLKQAKDSLLAPHNAAVDAALVRVCLRHGLDFAFDSDVVQLRFINPNVGVDITSLVIDEVLNPVQEPAPRIIVNAGSAKVVEEAVKEDVAEDSETASDAVDSNAVATESTDSVIDSVDINEN